MSDAAANKSAKDAEVKDAEVTDAEAVDAKAEAPKDPEAEAPEAEAPEAEALEPEQSAPADVGADQSGPDDGDDVGVGDVEDLDDDDDVQALRGEAASASTASLADSEISKVARLERLTRDSFPGVEELELFDHPGGYIAAVRVGDKVDEKARLALGRQLVELFAGQGVLVEPLLYRGAAWAKLEGVAGSKWPALLSAEGRAKELHELYRTKRPYPRDFRRLLLSSARSYLTFIELILREAPFPLHLLASLSSEVMRDALELLFASRGLHFDGKAASLAIFEKEFAGAFSAEQLALYFQLRGLARQARHFHDLGEDAPDDRFDWEPLAERLRGFFNDFERYAFARFSSASERSRRRILRIAVPSAIAVCSIVGVLWTYSALKPLEPVKPAMGAALRAKQGGIKATYFKGKNFEKKVAERVDRMINIHTSGVPEPKAGRDGFSVRWQGYLRFLKDDRHAVCLESDDGARLWLGDKLVVDDWDKHRKRKKCTKVRVKRGWYPLKVEYYDDKGVAVAQLKVGLNERGAKVVRHVDLCCKDPKPKSPKRAPTKARVPVKRVLPPTAAKGAKPTPKATKPGAALRKPTFKRAPPKSGAKKPGAKKPIAKKPTAKKR